MIKVGVFTACVLPLCLLYGAPLWQPPPPRPPRVDVPTRVADITRKLGSTTPVNTTAKLALQFSRIYLGEAREQLRQAQLFRADRLAGAADALIHIAEHQDHLQQGGPPKGPPPANDIKNHLQHVYFRVSQANFFLRESHDRNASSFPKWAREFYQSALRSLDHNELLAADENAKCADEVVRALENLAQAASPMEIPPPPGGPPPPK